MKAPAKTETGTGTTTASHRDVVAAVVGVIAAGEADTETEGADVATLGTGPPRYENLLLPSTPLSCLYHQIEWVFITGV